MIQRSIVTAPRGFGHWVCTKLSLQEGDVFTARFERGTSTDWVEVDVVPKGTPGRVFVVLDHCAVRYRGAIASPDADLREQVRQLVLGVAATVDAGLAAAPGSTIGDVLGRRHESGAVVFGREMLREMLAPTVVDGVAVVDGWMLVDIYPSSYARETLGETLELVLEFRRERDQRRTLLVVSERRDDEPCFARTASFSVSYLSLGGADRDGAESLRALVTFALTLRDHEGLDVTFPGVATDVAGALPAPKSADARAEPAQWLNLAISAECSQSCRFCSIKEWSPARDGGDALFARLAADLDAARARGVEGIRVNGYDPLAYSRIVDLLTRARDLGFARAQVFSPCTRLADRSWCESIVNVLPKERCFFVPLYAVSPELHDAVVGRAGAHALVLQALEHLIELVGAPSLAILSVVTRDNLEELPRLARFARERGISFSAHMPYPSAESRTDRYFECVPRQGDVAAAFARALQERSLMPSTFPVSGVAPCVAFRAMRAARVPIKTWLDVPERRPLLPGTEYKDPSFTHGAGRRQSAAFVSASLPCPHQADCALSLACPGELLRAYVDRYGIDEIGAVSLRELIDAP